MKITADTMSADMRPVSAPGIMLMGAALGDSEQDNYYRLI